MFNYSKDNDNIVTITMDMQGRSANVINQEFGKLWLDTIDRLEKEKAEIAGVVLTSAKSTFFAGADIDDLFKQTDAKLIFEMCEGLKKQLRQPRNIRKTCSGSLKWHCTRWRIGNCVSLSLPYRTQ
jgi:3-hydroxyacyl-CoA dehydrogenase/enoyl-CoA hydratase/3-hydroxybutyryl-CoA epimerase